MERNLTIYPYFQAARSLLFWQALWFLYFEGLLSADQAILLAAIYDLGTVFLEVPSGYLSDYLGRRVTLVIATAATALASLLLYTGSTFAVFVVAQLGLGVGSAFISGTDSALLYDSLRAVGRENQVAEYEARSWRYQFAGLAVSAAIGGLLSLADIRLAFLASATAALISLGLALAFRDPEPQATDDRASPPLQQLRNVVAQLKQPPLLWIFAFAVAGYVFSHVSWVFGQPYLKLILSNLGASEQTPLIMGGVISMMMVVSLIAGFIAVPLRRRIGIAGSLMLAMIVQVGLIIAMALVTHLAAVALLLVRMVPSALSRPFVLEVIQPRIKSGYRATYLSMQNLVARLAFAGTLLLSSWAVGGIESLNRSGMTLIFGGYGIAGIIVLVVLLASRRQLGEIGQPLAMTK